MFNSSSNKSIAKSARSILFALVIVWSLPGHTNPSEAEGSVNFFVDAKSDFDIYTENPDSSRQQWMRENFYRMQTYSPYFDDRLSWYPMAWEYQNAYGIGSGDSLVSAHPEWILKDTDGSRLYISFGCSGGTCPRYAGDIGNPEFRTWWIHQAKQKISTGYLGLWVDDVNLLWRIGDGGGNSVRPIDPRTGKEMTLADWRRYFVELLEELRSAVPNAEIVHNFIWYADDYRNQYVSRQIAAADYLNFERGISDSGIRGGDGKYGFETFLDLIDYAHSIGVNVVLDDDDDQSVKDRDYELAFYFLINDRGDLIGADGDRSRMNPDNFWSGYATELGSANGDRYVWNGLFRRDFDCGIVLVNQPDSLIVTVSLGEPYTDLEGVTVSSVTLEDASGEVLTQRCDQATEPMPPSNLTAD